MIRFVTAMEEKEKVWPSDKDILEEFIKTNPNYLNL